jgi:hypothetical protein
MKYIYLMSALSLLPTLNALAQEVSFFRVTAETRYDNLDWGRERNRIQSALRVWTHVDLGSGLSARVLGSSGSRFQSRWSTATDFEPPRERDFMEIFVRQLYLQYDKDNWRVQMGVIPPVKNLASSTGLEASGWLDGIRLTNEVVDGFVVELVAGGLNNLDEPNAFTRPRELNYAEIELTKQFSDRFGAEISAEIVDKNAYSKLEFSYKHGNKSPRFVSELLLNASDETVSFGLSAQQDLNTLFSGRSNSGVNVFILYSYVDEAIGLRGTLADDFYAFGHALKVELEGPLSRKSGLGWFARQVFMSPSRSTAGIRVTLQAR